MREHYSFAHPNERAPRFHTQIFSTLPYSCSNDGWAVRVDGGQGTGRFNGGNLQDCTSFICRPVALFQ